MVLPGVDGEEIRVCLGDGRTTRSAQMVEVLRRHVFGVSSGAEEGHHHVFHLLPGRYLETRHPWKGLPTAREEHVSS